MNAAIIRSEDYSRQMKTIVEPFLESSLKSGYFESRKDEPIYYEYHKADAPVGNVVIVHGFSECVKKYNESVFYFLKEHYSVFLIQQEGHGKSFRSVADLSKIQIPDYHDLVDDLTYFVKNIVMPNGDGLPLFLYSHSMGGAVSVCTMQQNPDMFQKAILSSPMMEINTGKVPVLVDEILCRISIMTGHSKKYIPGSHPFDSIPDYDGSGAASMPRFEYSFDMIKNDPEYQTCGTTYQTSLELIKMCRQALDRKRCARIKIPVLLLSAGNDAWVGARGQRKLLDQLSTCESESFPGVKHELFTADENILARYWQLIFNFLDR